MIFPWTFEFFSTAMSLRAKQSTKHWHWTDTSMEGNLLLARSNWANAEQRASNYSFQSLATGKWVAAQYELGWRIVGTGTSVWPFVLFFLIRSNIPSGKHTKSYWTWSSRNSWFTPKMVFFHSFLYVYQRVQVKDPRSSCEKMGLSPSPSDVWVSPSCEKPGYRHRKVAARVQVGLEQTGGRGDGWAQELSEGLGNYPLVNKHRPRKWPIFNGN